MQMFLWNNLFFSLGFDTSDHYEPLGGNSAAHAAALCDLRGAQVDGIDFLAVICAIPSDAVSKPKVYANINVSLLFIFPYYINGIVSCRRHTQMWM